MATASTSTSSTHSCHRCAVRKVRCDKRQPCAACTRHDVECEYRILPARRRRKKTDRNSILTGRLEQYDRPIRQKSVDAIKNPRIPHQDASFVTANVSDLTTDDASSLRNTVQSMGDLPEAKLLQDQSRSKYLNSGLWNRVVEELADPADALGHSSDENTDEDAAQDNVDFVLGLNQTSVTMGASHPPAAQLLELWHVFKENFDPLCKVVHSPTLQLNIQKVIDDLSSLPKSFEALLFAIYTAAVVSLNNYDCERRFGESRKTLLLRYRVATRKALSRAKLMGSADLVVLQALLIHLLSSRDVYDSRTFWTLTGVALRIAEGMGLHRDGSLLKLPPFDTEIRRRIWWQLKLLDGDSAEASGSNKFGALDPDPRSPMLPSNINDDELHSNLSSIPVGANGATDMIFCALRFDLRRYWATKTAIQPQQDSSDQPWKIFGPGAPMDERDKALDEFENYLETKYIRYCDPSRPIQLLATLLARAAVSTSRLIAHHPRNWASEEQIPDSERRYVWDLSMKSIRQYNAIYINHELERFTWHAAFYFRWPAFIHILDMLRINPLAEKADQAWQLVDEVFAINADFVTNTQKALHVAVGNLCLKAYKARQNALARDGKPIPSVPPYINALHRQREIAITRRKSRDSATGNEETAVTSLPIDSQTMSKQRNTPYPMTGSQEQPTKLRETAFSEASDSIRPDLWPSDHNTQGSDDQFMFTNGNANMDIDMLFAQDDSMGISLDQTIDWAKWDALLGDFT